MQPSQNRPHDAEELADAILAMTRSIVGIALRTLTEETEDMTIVQFRLLATLGDHGSQRVADLAALLGGPESSVSRTALSLEQKGLLSKTVDPQATRFEITAEGVALVGAVTARRLATLGRIARQIPAEQRKAMVAAMRTFAAMAGEGPTPDWLPGWTR